jgi:NitT/TauT family transport system permease protein
MQTSAQLQEAGNREFGDGVASNREQNATVSQRIASIYRERKQLILGVISVAIVLLFWEIIVDGGWFNEFFASKPSAIGAAEYLLFTNGTIFSEIGTTCFGFAAGFALAILIGVPLGIMIGWYPTLEGLTHPYVAGLNATPRIALYPLFVVWFGVGLETKIVIVFISSMLPILFNTIGGVKSLDPSFIDVARCMGANDRQVFRTVAVPATVPFIMTGLRIGTGHALLATIIAEMFIGSHGLGALLSTYSTYFQTARLMAVILIIAASGVLLLNLIQWVEEKVEFWRPRV